MQTLKKILLAAILIYPGKSFCQDIHFSQYFNFPMLINPAYTGNFEGDWQASAAYRNQWKSLAQPFRTLAVSYERQLYIQSHHFSAGLFILNDNSGNIALKANHFVFSGAYHRIINNHSLHGGLQVGYVHKVVDFGDNTFPDQWDPVLGYYNPALNTGVEDGDRLSYLDLNFGLMWQKKISKFTPEAGVSFFHLNFPRESFYGENRRLPLKWSVHTGIKYDLSPGFYLTPAVLLMNQVKASDYIVGLNAGFSITPNSSGVNELSAGVYLRNMITTNTDAIILMAGTNVRNIRIGISYDLNISALEAYSNNRGAFEITLIYRSISTILNTFTIPCERL